MGRLEVYQVCCARKHPLPCPCRTPRPIALRQYPQFTQAGIEKNYDNRASCLSAFKQYKDCRGKAQEEERRQRAEKGAGIFS